MSDNNIFGNFFARPEGSYSREVAVHEYYVQDQALYLSTMTGRPIAETKQFVLDQLKPGAPTAFKSPAVTYLTREENGDRAEKRDTLWNYLRNALKDEQIIAPTFTTYVSTKKNKSLLAGYVEDNIAGRNKAKKEMFVAKTAGDLVTAAIKEVEQKGKKLANNSMSGAHVSASTPLYNKTAHSTLTSTCRTTAGLGSANNEKFLTGNRHYHNYQVVLANIVAIVQNADYAKIQAVVDKYALHLPTAHEALMCVTYSSQLYWWDKGHSNTIKELLDKLTPIQLAAFVYSGDMYHLRKYNEQFMFGFLTRLSTRVTGEHSSAMAVIKAAPESYINLAHQLCRDETKGFGKKYQEMSEQSRQSLALTLENIGQTCFDHRDLIEAFWMPEIMPASVAYFPSSIRRSVLTSDTDSTIFTVQEWIEWYNGGTFAFTPATRGVYVAVVFLASMTITHVLAKLSANLGIVPEYQGKIQMKSEFTFDVFVPTQLGKHYFAAISCQEGNVYDELEYEIKGAQLRSANVPVLIVEDAKKMLMDIIHSTLDNKPLSLQHYLTWVANTERMIEKSITDGELRFLRGGSIKDVGSYAGKPDESPYQNHFLWNEVFGPKYGMMPDPPYDTYKISVTTDGPSKFKAWLESMQDKELAARMSAYMLKREKKDLSTLHLPREILKFSGIPPEVVDIIDIPRIQMDICKIYSIVLETLGYYYMGDKVKRLLSKSGY